MKYLLAYVIWNKVNMLEWLTDGIVESFVPKDIDIFFLLDNPVDGTDKKIDSLYHKLKIFNYGVESYATDHYKFKLQNEAMKYCTEHNYKAVICPQDDQKITDKNLIKNIEKVIDEHGDKLGLIGMRDGFDYGYQNMVSSEWSESAHVTRRLKSGEYVEAKLLNDGGLIYTSDLIKKIGYHDVETYKRFYIEDDYCMRANQAGLTNIVMGNNLIHNKENASLNSTHYDAKEDYAKHDLAALRKKWNL